jgi:hypothetical protein
MLIPAGIVGGIKTIRTMPISDLFISTGVARIFAGNTDKQSPLDKGIDEICQPLHPRWMATCLVAAGLGSFLMTQIIVPEIPEGSAAFAPPVKAIEFLRRSPPAGRMLNDADFGDVMMWQLEQTPPVFIDTRYNLFGNQVLQDYWTMALCRSGWHDLLDKYVIDWVFLPPDLALIKALGKDADWHLVYQDKASVIYARHQPPLGK